MNLVECIKEYLDVEQEVEVIVEKNCLDKNWFVQGFVEFINYFIWYCKELDFVLCNFMFKIEVCEKIGIVGRIGVGKSLFILVIFCVLEVDEGKILIDGVDIGQVGLCDLCEGIIIVFQEFIFFMGII